MSLMTIIWNYLNLATSWITVYYITYYIGTISMELFRQKKPVKGMTCKRYELRHFIHMSSIWASAQQNHKMPFAPSEDSDQPGHPPSLITVFAVRTKKAWFLSYPLSAQRRFWSDWADAQANLSLRWVHLSFCWFSRALAHVLHLAKHSKGR